ncbi:T9SS type A sorting domain-containing protein [Aquimarina sp. RZ0]|uniref:T9SS type A sorting domain-containing protein n=1 Tax=Aquimarina sp. RZ0 TaxID=2607730 RepID=UPI0011F1DA12|nr:T9SS type A sorting domain-containing protein [Aquimarina sp. RZ0]KAA1244028.1 T9SS type A sorting domain-containing protein [Aquimarina sp. RZ0]
MKIQNTSKHSLIILAILLLGLKVINAQPVAAPNGHYWSLFPALTDEFNEAFDSEKWTKPLWAYDNTPTAMITSNSGVSGGNMWIRATAGSGNKWFLGSRVSSKTPIIYPMYTECRIKASNLSAFNTFWMNAGDAYNREEIDILEANANPSCCVPRFPYTMNSQYFKVVNGNEIGRNKGDFDKQFWPDYEKRNVTWFQDYHTVGVYWESPYKMTFYLDGSPTKTVHSIYLSRPMFLNWDIWTSDNWYTGGIANREDLYNHAINTMYVDYVRTWKAIPVGYKTLNSDSDLSASKKISVAPNFVTNYTTVKGLKTGKTYKYQVVNVGGAHVINGSLYEENNRINTENLPSGVYFINMASDKEETVLKIVVL